jgi:hypothetical protein
MTTPHVLVVSRDPMLLHTRQLILGAFFQVHGAGRVCEVEDLLSRYSFDLLILCYTLCPSECRTILDLLAGLKRQPRILALNPVGGAPAEPLPGPVTMTEAGPYHLLKKSAEMLGVDIRMKTNLVEV